MTRQREDFVIFDSRAKYAKARMFPPAAVGVLFALSVFGAAKPAGGPRVILAPKFTVGETLVYEIESHTSTAGDVVTSITNNEGVKQSSLTIGLRERLEILAMDAQPQPGATSIRMRITWDEAHANATTDAVDPTAANPAEPFAKLQGQSMEFTLAPDGAISKMTGLENIVPGGVPPIEALSWISSLNATRSFPRTGISVGQQWSAERPITGAPLAGLSWQLHSTYERAEPCPPVQQNALADTSATATSPPASSVVHSQECAVIESDMTIARHGSSRSDATPEDYLHQGLRTSGTWTGSGAELGSISIDSGLLVSATETSSQNADYEITSASTGSSIHYTAKVESQTGITLVSESQQSQPAANPAK